MSEKESTICELSKQLEELKTIQSKSKNFDLKISNLTEKLKSAEKERDSLIANLKSTEAQTEKLKLEINGLNFKLNLAEGGLFSANEERSKTVSYLLEKVRNLEKQKAERDKELSNKNDLFESTKKDQLQNLINIKQLKSQNFEISEKLKNVEKEKQKTLDDLSWAQNFYSSMEKRIKELEIELSIYKNEFSEADQKPPMKK